MNVTDARTDDHRARRRKVAALLAGGLVVGVGTMATLASWNDVEYASGSFTAGAFKLLGSTDQSTFADHGTTAQSLTFTTGFDNLTPTDTVYAPYALRLDKSSTNQGTVVVSAGATSGTIANITYQLFTTTSAGCTASATVATTVVSSGTALGSVGTPTSFTLAKPATATTDGAPVYLCFKVTAGSSLAQAQTGSATWVFTATSS